MVDKSSPRPRLAPLVLATMASQALLVVLSPTIVAIGDELDASVGAVGQARSITAAVAIAASVAMAGRVDAVGVPRLLGVGAVGAIVACGAVAAAPTLAAFLASHVLVGFALACLLSAGFAGVAAFRPERRAWALGYVTGANALAWIVVNPVVGLVTAFLSWRAAQAVPTAIAVGALLAARSASSSQAGPTVPRLRSLIAVRSARRWIAAELIAYGGWTALLTYIGAFFLQTVGVGEGAVGWFLAAGAGAYFVAATRSTGLIDRMPRKQVVAGAAVLMAILVIVQFTLTGSVVPAVGVFCLTGLVAGVRTPASSGLGLEQLPDHPGAIMAARTAATQLGYLLGAVIGGAVIAGLGYGVLGFVLAVAMVASALAILRVEDPVAATLARR
jgi:predicted MFS family arabinose efflux permease